MLSSYSRQTLVAVSLLLPGFRLHPNNDITNRRWHPFCLPVTLTVGATSQVEPEAGLCQICRSSGLKPQLVTTLFRSFRFSMLAKEIEYHLAIIRYLGASSRRHLFCRFLILLVLVFRYVALTIQCPLSTKLTVYQILVLCWSKVPELETNYFQK